MTRIRKAAKAVTGPNAFSRLRMRRQMLCAVTTNNVLAPRGDPWARWWSEPGSATPE